jgi:hypothetical protein
MIKYSEAVIKQIAVHQVGNKQEGEDLFLSEDNIALTSKQLHDILLKYFLSNFNSPERFEFTFSNGDFTLNPIYQYATTLFDKPKSFHEQSVNLAKHLYETSLHPNIKSGDFYVALLENIEIDGQAVDAVGVFKSETKDTFLKLLSHSGSFQLEHELGINTNKLDKGCLILNVKKESGYKICIVDKSNKGGDALYWKDQFLNLKPCADEYHHTQNFLNVAKNFVTKQLAEEYEVTKADQAAYLNKSIEYFKQNEEFDSSEFAKKVFEQPDVIDSFSKFKTDFQAEKNIELAEDFTISAPAVKKQAKVFKSVIKLDKNFHIYVHGKRELIERGVEPDGRKYYKIYYSEEN